MKKYIFLMVLLTFLVGCSNKSLYQIGQSNTKETCLRNARNSNDIHACQNTKHQSYEEYEEERQSIINE